MLFIEAKEGSERASNIDKYTSTSTSNSPAVAICCLPQPASLDLAALSLVGCSASSLIGRSGREDVPPVWQYGRGLGAAPRGQTSPSAFCYAALTLLPPSRDPALPTIGWELKRLDQQNRPTLKYVLGHIMGAD